MSASNLTLWASVDRDTNNPCINAVWAASQVYTCTCSFWWLNSPAPAHVWHTLTPAGTCTAGVWRRDLREDDDTCRNEYRFLFGFLSCREFALFYDHPYCKIRCINTRWSEMLSSFSRPNVVQNLFMTLSCVEHRGRYFEKCLWICVHVVEVSGGQ